MTRFVEVLVMVVWRGAIDKHLQALEIATLFMLLTTAGVTQVEIAALSINSPG